MWNWNLQIKWCFFREKLPCQDIPIGKAKVVSGTQQLPLGQKLQSSVNKWHDSNIFFVVKKRWWRWIKRRLENDNGIRNVPFQAGNIKLYFYYSWKRFLLLILQDNIEWMDFFSNSEHSFETVLRSKVAIEFPFCDNR